MKVWKIVSGIISIVFSALTLPGLFLVMMNPTGLESLSYPLLAMVFILAGGITSIATSSKKSVAMVVLYAIAVIIFAASYSSGSEPTFWIIWAAASIIAEIVNLAFLKTPALNTENQTTVLPMNDDSMEPDIPEGSRLVIRLTKNVPNGETLAVKYKDRILIRVVLYEQNWAMLKPNNKDYDIIELDNSTINELEVIGIVEKVIKI